MMKNKDTIRAKEYSLECCLPDKFIVSSAHSNAEEQLCSEFFNQPLL